MDDTARFESAQALFCAIADLVGKSNIDKVLNLTKYPTYTDFANGHRDPKFKGKSNRDRINLAAKQIDTTADLDTIETFLINNNSWYISTIKIASHLIEFLWKVDADFKSISRKNFLSGKKSIYYFRGDDDVMGKIEDCFKLANNNTKYLKNTNQIPFGDVNKWSPADIYYCSLGAKKEIADHLTAAKKMEAYSFNDLNTLIDTQIEAGQLLPLSLKKQTKTVVLEKVNFDIPAKTKVIEGKATGQGKVVGGLWYGGRKPYKKWNGSILYGSWHMPRQTFLPFEPLTVGDKTDAPTRDIKIIVSNTQNRSTDKGTIQMRHDASTNSWKVDFSYTGAEARGGSIVSWSKFADLLSLVNPTVATNFKSAWKEGQVVWKSQMETSYTNPAMTHTICCPTGSPQSLKKHRKLIEGSWKKEYTVPNLNQTKISTLFPNGGTKGRPSPYSDLRGEVATLAILNRVGPVIVNWLDSPEANVIPKGYTTNQVDRFIRLLFKYVTSQSTSSGKFVIAK